MPNLTICRYAGDKSKPCSRWRQQAGGIEKPTPSGGSTIALLPTPSYSLAQALHQVVD
jgi:hypothetical protein